MPTLQKRHQTARGTACGDDDPPRLPKANILLSCSGSYNIQQKWSCARMVVCVATTPGEDEHPRICTREDEDGARSWHIREYLATHQYVNSTRRLPRRRRLTVQLRRPRSPSEWAYPY